MQVAGMKPMDDAAALPIQGGVFAADRPVAGQPPLVEPRTASLIDLTGILNSTAERNEVPGLVVADIEKSSSLKLVRRHFVIDVLPAPDGAVIMMIFSLCVPDMHKF